MAIGLIAVFVLAAVAVFALAARLVTRSSGPDVSFIAVVPFADLNSAHGTTSFGAQFAAGLAHALQKTTGVHLVERAQAATLIEGSLQCLADRCRVAVWLVRASDRRALWSEHYEFAPGETGAVHQHIVLSIRKALHL